MGMAITGITSQEGNTNILNLLLLGDVFSPRLPWIPLKKPIDSICPLTALLKMNIHPQILLFSFAYKLSRLLS